MNAAPTRVNLAPAGPHVLDTSAVVHLLRQRLTASAEAFVPFATLGELATGTFRAAQAAILIPRRTSSWAQGRAPCPHQA